MTLNELKGILPDGTIIKVRDVYANHEVLEEIKINAYAIGLRSKYKDCKVTCFNPETNTVKIMV